MGIILNIIRAIIMCVRGDGEPLCIICLQPANFINYPCGHLVLCRECTEKIADRYAPVDRFINVTYDLVESRALRCPMCRATSLPTQVYTS